MKKHTLNMHQYFPFLCNPADPAAIS